jgi:5-methylcytosine-specific restriction endonuclease McrA
MECNYAVLVAAARPEEDGWAGGVREGAQAAAKLSPGGKPKRRLTMLQKKKVASKAQWRCSRCQALVDFTYEIDHIRPLSEGGSDSPDNLRLLCRNCHGRITADQTIQRLKTQPR